MNCINCALTDSRSSLACGLSASSINPLRIGRNAGSRRVCRVAPRWVFGYDSCGCVVVMAISEELFQDVFGNISIPDGTLANQLSKGVDKRYGLLVFAPPSFTIILAPRCIVIALVFAHVFNELPAPAAGVFSYLLTMIQRVLAPPFWMSRIGATRPLPYFFYISGSPTTSPFTVLFWVLCAVAAALF